MKMKTTILKKWIRKKVKKRLENKKKISIV